MDNASTARTNLGLVIGTDVQAYNEHLTDLADGSLTATKIAGGIVDNTEFDYLDGVTSNIQTQLNTLATMPLVVTATKSTALTVPTNTNFSVPDWSIGVSVNNNGAFDVTTGVFTATVAGVYEFTLGIQYDDGNWSSGDRAVAFFRKNGSLVNNANVARDFLTVSGNYRPSSLFINTIVELEVGDTVDPTVFQNSGNNQSLATYLPGNYINIKQIK